MELQAVILAGGRGSRFIDLTESCPKAFLLVGNKPLIWYPLFQLQLNGFKSAFVIIQEKNKEQMTKFKSDFISDTASVESKLKIDVDVLTTSGDEDGTADSLRKFSESFKSDLLVLSCDLLMSIPLRKLVDLHWMHDATLTVLFTGTPTFPPSAPGHKMKMKHERDLVGLDPESSRIAFFSSAADVEEEQRVDIRIEVLKQFPRITFENRLLDAHCYILKNWVLRDFLREEKSLAMLKGEVIPKLVALQFDKKENGKEDNDGSVLGNGIIQDSTAFIRSPWTDHSGGYDDPYFGQSVRCYALISETGTPCFRCNSLPSYWEACRNWESIWQAMGHKESKIQGIVVDEKLVDKHSLVDKGAKLGSMVSLKHTVVGKRCNVGKLSKLVNCVIFDNVTIGANVHLSDSIVCASATIEDDCELKQVIVCAEQTVSKASKLKMEVITDGSRYMEI